MIRKMTYSDIKEVVYLHKRELTGFLSQLGIGFLEKYYEVSLKLPEVFTFVYSENGKIKGFASNTTDSRGLQNKILLRSPIGFGYILLKYFITHPFKFFKSFRLLRYPGLGESGAELLSLAVERSSQKKGIGRMLLRESRAEFRKRRIDRFKISVYDRLPANGFYIKCGSKLVRSFGFMGEKMNSYELKV